jgi:hypothetical protein
MAVQHNRAESSSRLGGRFRSGEPCSEDSSDLIWTVRRHGDRRSTNVYVWPLGVQRCAVVLGCLACSTLGEYDEETRNLGNLGTKT